MSSYDIGRIVVKTRGREAGNYAIIVDVIDKNYLLVDGLKIRRRRVNFNHVEPTQELIEVKKGATHDELEAAIKKAKLTDKMKETISIPIR
jgi:large subunit ribosomal protein L14e